MSISSALLDVDVEERRELGQEIGSELDDRTVASVQARLTRRAVGNLLDNAHR